MKSICIAILACITAAGCTDTTGSKPAATQSAEKQTSYPVVTSSKEIPGLVGQCIFVQGVAKNEKYSAYIAGPDVFVWDKPSWPDNVLGKSVLVRGDLSVFDDSAATKNANGEIVQTTGSKLYILKNTKWSLAYPEK